MIQLLVSLIEWFAVLALSSLGIAYAPSESCAAPEPTEFRQAVVWIPADGFDSAMTNVSAEAGCRPDFELPIISAKPVFGPASDRYDS